MSDPVVLGGLFVACLGAGLWATRDIWPMGYRELRGFFRRQK